MNKTNKLPTRFHFSHSGDPSVGISGESCTVTYEGEFYDGEYQREFVEAIRDALTNVWDNARIHVIEEHTHTCRYCEQDFDCFSDYCESVCSEKACRIADFKREAEDMAEQAAAQEAHWNAMSEAEKDAMMSGADNWREQSERNSRLASRINGAGLLD